MRVVGVIAEYNPFHLGHAHQLTQAREKTKADAIVVVMSSVFTQRGDPALLSPLDRARMALHEGADAVFALPAAWAVRDAEHFALGGVSLLAGLGCSAISFGTEMTELTQLQEAARLLESPDESFSLHLQSLLGSGMPHPAALSSAMEAALPGGSKLLENPNSTLAICYLRALIRLHSKMEVIPIQRIGHYHDTSLSDALPSATALRGAILRGDWPRVRSAMPEEAFHILREAAENNHLHRPAHLDAATLYRLRTMSPADYAALPDISEGIENRLASAAESALSRSTLLLTAKTRRYPYARLSRLTTHALLGFTNDFVASNPLPQAAWLLGFRRESRDLFTHIKSSGTLPVLGKASDLDRNAAWIQAELRAYDIWALGAGQSAGLALTQGIAVV